MKKSILSVVLITVLLSLVAVAACAKPSPTPAPAAPKPAPTAPAPPTTPAPTAKPASPSPAAVEIKPVTLKLAYYVAPTHIYGKAVTNFVDAVSQRTGGKVTIQMFPSEQLVKGSESLEAVKKGVVDMAIISGQYQPSELGYIGDAGALPFQGKMSDGAKIAGALRPEFENMLKPHNQRLLFQVTVLVDPFFSKPIDPNTADLKGYRVRAPSRVMLDTAKVLGGTPTSISIGEVASAVATGALDGAFTAWDWVVDGQLMDLFKYAYRADLFIQFGNCALTINLDVFNKLQPEVRDIILDQAPKSEQFMWQQFQSSTDGFIKRYKDAKGVTFAEFTPAQQATWRNKTGSVYAAFVKTYGTKGEDWLKTVEKVTGTALPSG